MRYYCDIKKKSKHSHIKSRSHKEIEKYNHIILSFKNVDIKDVDEILYLYIKDYNKDCKYHTINVSLSNYLRDAIDNLKEEGYDFSHIAEMDFITLAHKRDKTYDFYLKHNMSAFEWKFNSMINKDKNIINEFPKNWWHPINTKFNYYHL